MKIYVQQRELVTPGQLLAEGDDVQLLNQYVVKVGKKVYANIVGLVEVQDNKIGIIPLEGAYIPRVGDTVIGLVTDLGLTYWIVDIRSPYSAYLPVGEALNKPFNPVSDDLRKYFNVGDYLVAKVIAFDRTKNPTLTVKGKGLGKIIRGRVIEIKPSRVPRVIGKKSSMLNMLKELTSCEIVVGANGRIWISGEDRDLEDIAVLAIEKIEREAHIPGLTDRVKAFIEEEKKRRGKK